MFLEISNILSRFSLAFGNYTNGVGLRYTTNGGSSLYSIINVACDITVGTGELYDIHYGYYDNNIASTYYE